MTPVKIKLVKPKPIAGNPGTTRKKKGTAAIKVAAGSNTAGKKKKKKVTGKKEKKTLKQTKVDPASLDMEMDSYLHKAGKGPDPKQAALDREMEAYKAVKAAGTAN